jgi:hypothetical protein
MRQSLGQQHTSADIVSKICIGVTEFTKQRDGRDGAVPSVCDRLKPKRSLPRGTRYVRLEIRDKSWRRDYSLNAYMRDLKEKSDFKSKAEQGHPYVIVMVPKQSNQSKLENVQAQNVATDLMQNFPAT